MLKLYDLVPTHERGPFFSPVATKARLALASKGIQFNVVPVTYKELQTVWKEEFKIKMPTVPFIQKEDGSYLIDSDKICHWADQAYPTGPSIFLPTQASDQVDFQSEEYKQAAAKDISQRSGFPYQTQAYWTSDDRLGPGFWARVSSRDQSESNRFCSPSNRSFQLIPSPHSISYADECLAELQKGLDEFGEKHLNSGKGQLYLQDLSAPGHMDFSLMGFVRMLSACSHALVKETFARPDTHLAKWLDRMLSHDEIATEWKALSVRDPA
ncbi:BZ3500_MvSof-1268-A1-R1_Chr4-3g07319 [Microbotryum saponariae]|uniref:BZ3500_MvSof-1268-A1-R1_Chr4-3g07319 protein n=1 Tax=Microbotryum saponariae TaxID=289078 RepID=A0A2X0MXU9_9BASI|nr:BZ3500_MvSof-1268-A1-R1_Chr4-3g07319 [Microbotryum saponariae]SDA06982.1 BZ3501_MvSof-1269-A2-R1_Chr4-2g07028 [Microbotryum saponariae]